mmetsp:Transcript_97209/g.296952  ORF Transcript_97209/g.296952 Transcript_97209/m.296952 type:complete len:198 (-) Transcript_97209:27-620(-)
MMLPMPALPAHHGPPTEYMVSRRSRVLGVLVAQTVVCVMRVLVLRPAPVMDAFIMALAIGFGWYAYREDMHLTYFLYWGMMCLINGAFDLVKLIEVWVNAGTGFSIAAGASMANLQASTLVAVPCVSLAGAVIAWYMYKHHAEGDSGSYSERAPLRPPATQRSAQPSAACSDFRPAPARPSQSFQSFSGAGQKLGSV